MKEERGVSVIESYYIKVTKLVIILIMFSIAAGSLMFPLIKFLGCFETMTWGQVAIFFFCVGLPEELIFLYLFQGIVKDGRLVEKRFKLLNI